ncbi:MAG: flippase-like domain-containing protein [Deltaproteobacteria bacterium]|nr:flippase-like domain-containing protein [Deltaproteobacteria bacterium]
MKRRVDFNLVAALLGAAVLAYLLYRLGFRQVLQQVALVGWGWPLIIGQEILPILANTAAWHYAFAVSHRSVSFWNLFKMRQAGDGFNYLIPSATMGGELLRVSLLRRDVSLPRGAAAVTIAKFTQFLGQGLFIALGLALAAPFAPLRPGLLPWLWVLLAGCFVLLLLILLGLWLGMFSRLTTLLTAWLPHRLARYLPVDKVAELDSHIASFLKSQQAGFWASTGLFTLAWALGAVEVFLIFYFLGLPIDLPTAVTVETLSVFIDAVLFFVPGKLGTQEGGKVLIFLSLGLPPVSGLAFGIIRRIRELAWAGVGMALLATFREKRQEEEAPGT